MLKYVLKKTGDIGGPLYLIENSRQIVAGIASYVDGGCFTNANGDNFALNPRFLFELCHTFCFFAGLFNLFTKFVF